VFFKYGIKSKGKYLYYTVGKDSAVFLAVKKKKNQDTSNIVIPPKIGKYIVRGIATPLHRAIAVRNKEISSEELCKLEARLYGYCSVKVFKNCTLPETVEYIGALPEYCCSIDAENYLDRFVLHKNVSYVENSNIPTKTLVLPKDIKYIGHVTEHRVHEEIITENESCDEGVPHYSLEQYRGNMAENELSHSKIAKNAFFNHHNLRNIILPDGITEIEELAFSNIGQVEHFHFPKNLEKLSDTAFENMQLTGTFRYPSDFPIKLKNNSYNFKITGKILLEDFEHFDVMINSQNSEGELFAKYATELDFSSLEGKLPDRAFCNKDLFVIIGSKQFILGDNITEIGESAFEGTPISNLILPSKLLSIGKNAFKDCPCLKKLSLPDSLESVDEGAFATKCELIISASAETFSKISGQKGYIEYTQRIDAIYRKSEEFIEKYKDFFAGKQTKNVPNVYDLVKIWIDNGQNPKIYEKLLDLLKTPTVRYIYFSMLIDRARFLGLNAQAEEFGRTFVKTVEILSQSKLPSDWLVAYNLTSRNGLSFYKIVKYLLSKYTEDAPEHFLVYIDSFMDSFSNSAQVALCQKNKTFPEHCMKTLNDLYEKNVGKRYYKKNRDSFQSYTTETRYPAKSVGNLDRDLIEECKKACDENSPYAYFWRDLAVAFSPNFKPPKCTPKPKTEKTKTQKTVSTSTKTYVPQFNPDFDFATTDTTYTSSDSYSFRYTEEERRRADEIIHDCKLQKDAEIYVAYLLGDIDAPDNLDSLVDEFSGIDWSEFGDGDV